MLSFSYCSSSPAPCRSPATVVLHWDTLSRRGQVRTSALPSPSSGAEGQMPSSRASHVPRARWHTGLNLFF